MGLADQILRHNEVGHSAPGSATDELGLTVPTPETTDYLIARALLLNRPPDSDPYGVHCLHLRNGSIWLAHRPLKETDQMLYQLTQVRHPVPKWQRVEFWREVKKYLPVLDLGRLGINEKMYWDREKGKVADVSEEVS